MDSKLKKRLEKLSNNPDELTKLLAEFLFEKKISINEIFELEVFHDNSNVITPNIICDIAILCIKNKKYDDAVALCLKKFDIAPLLLDKIENDYKEIAQFLVGYIYCEKKEFEKAFSYFKELPIDYKFLSKYLNHNNKYKRLYDLYTLYKSVDQDSTDNPIPEMSTTTLDNHIRIKKSSLKKMQDKELFTALKAEKRFFDPARTTNVVPRWFGLHLLRRRLSTEALNSEINLEDNTPFRRSITAELSTFEASKKSNGQVNPGFYKNRLGWAEKHKVDPSRNEWFSQYEKVQAGNSTFKYAQKVNAHPNHLGDYYMEGLGEYSTILSKINEITSHPNNNQQKINEQSLAQLMLTFVKKGKAITLFDLEKINDTVNDFDVNDINRICYHCFVKEPVRWMFHNNALPLAVAQARMLELIAEGHLSMEQTFAFDAPYGVVTVKKVGDHWNEVKDKIKALNRLYAEKILIDQVDDGTNSSHVFSKRKQFHAELKKTYGGDSDTDGAGYTSSEAEDESSDDESSPKPAVPSHKKLETP